MIKNKFLLILMIIVFLGCNSKKEPQFDIYSMNPDNIDFRGSYEWIDSIYLLKYKKKSNFKILVSKQKIDIKTPGMANFYKAYDESSLSIKEIDYHYDFILIFKGKNKVEKYSFSDILVTEFDCKPSSYCKVTGYTYNSKAYNDDECNFYLNSPAIRRLGNLNVK